MNVNQYLMLFLFMLSAVISRVSTAQINCASQAYILEQECAALEDIYYSTNGSSWTDSAGWLTDSDPCTSWAGISCENGPYCTPVDPPICYFIDRVTVVSLPSNNLSGTIPTSIDNLEVLSELSMEDNRLQGSIPSEIGNLVKLKTLSLYSNLLSGSIPSTISNLMSLTILYLHKNQLSGSIPTSIGNLTKINYLLLDENQLNGTIPSSIGNLSKLVVLYLDSNQLIGYIPPEIGTLTDLGALYINNNKLSGPIPQEIGKLTNLAFLIMRDNRFCGKIPTNITNLTNLFNDHGIDIQNNYLYTNDAVLDAFLIQKGGEWESSQGERCPADSEKTLLYQIQCH